MNLTCITPKFKSILQGLPKLGNPKAYLYANLKQLANDTNNEEERIELLNFVEKQFHIGLIKNLLLKNNIELTHDDLVAIMGGKTYFKEILDTESKTNNIDNPTENEEDIETSNYLYNVYKSSTAKTILLKNFKNILPSLFFIDYENGTEIATVEDMNQAIVDYQNKLLNQVKKYLQEILPESDFIKFKDMPIFDEEGQYTGVLEIIQRCVKPYRTNLYSINKLELLAAQYNTKNYYKLDGVNALFILEHFDSLLQDNFPNVEIKNGTFKLFIKNKYEVSQHNNNMNSTWRDDDKDYNYIKEISSLNKLFIEHLPKYDSSYNPTSLNLDLNIVSDLICKIKRQLSLENQKFKFSLENKLYKSLNENESNFTSTYLIGKSIADLVNNASSNSSLEGYRVLFKLLANPNYNIKHLGLTLEDKLNIYSIYKGIFDLTNQSSLISVFYNSLQDVNNSANKKRHNLYYQYLVLLFNSMESIELLEYQETDKGLENITLTQSNDIIKTLSFDRKLEGKFRVDKNYDYNNFKVITQLTDKEPNIIIKIGNLNITKYGKNKEISITDSDNRPIVLNDSVLNTLIPMFLEITGFTFNSHFNLLLKEYNSNYLNMLVKMSTNIIYNAEVAKMLYSIPLSLLEYKEKLETLYPSDDIPLIRESYKSISFTNKLDTPIKKILIRINNQLNNIITDNIVKDALGKAISLVGLSLIATKVQSQWNRIKKENPTINNSAFINYAGQEFARDYKGKQTKKATEYNIQENFIASFVHDFLTGLEIKIMPSIISDKSRIMKTKFTSIDPNTGNYNFSNVEEVKATIKKELGRYYNSVYTELKHQLNILTLELSINKTATLLLEGAKELNIDSSTIFDVDSNFKNYNTIIDLLVNTNRITDVNKFTSNLLHELIVSIQNKGGEIEIVNDLHIKIKKGKIYGNSLLFDLLFRWNIINESHPAYFSYNLSKGFTTAENFFSLKLELYLADLLQDNCEIPLSNSYFTNFKGDNYKLLRNNKEWVSNDKVVLGTITYNYINPTTGSIETKVIKITNKIDLKNSYIYKSIVNRTDSFYNQLSKTLKLSVEEIKQALDIENPNFNFNIFKVAILLVNSLDNVLKKLIKFDNIPYIEELSKLYNKTDKEIKIKIAEDYINLLFYNDISKNNIFNNTDIKEIKTIKEELDKSNLSKVKDDLIGFNSLVYITLHPNLEEYQWTDYLLSQNYMNNTVGTHITHPFKSNDLKIAESQAWGLLVKRNVSLTASKYAYITNTLEGLNQEATIAVIEDDKATVNNIYGLTETVKPFDGSSIECCVTNLLTNKSLGSNAVGIDKKPFIHDYKTKSGNGIIVKTATFAVTNDRIRNSTFYENINYKLLSRPIKFNNEIYYPNITLDYNNNIIDYGNILYKENGIIYKVESISFNTNTESGIPETIIKRSKYNGLNWEPVEKDKEVVIDSNYTLWKEVFGGAYSGTFDDNNNFIYDESSILHLTDAVNKIGIKKDPNIIPKDLTLVDLILKKALIDFIVTEGAIKQGAANINSREAYFNRNYKLATMKLRLDDAGIQLDAEHHADESVLSLMTQVVNALGARGYTAEEANEVYEALRSLSLLALKDFNLGIKTNNEEIIKLFFADIIVKTLKTTSVNDGNLAAALSNTIKEEFEKGELITYEKLKNNLPLENPAIFKLMVSLVASLLTKKSVRISFPGILSVLSPSNRIFLLFLDRMKSFYTEEELNNLGHGPKILNLSDIELGRTYTITTDVNLLPESMQKYLGTVDLLIETPMDYWNLIDLQKTGAIKSINENYRIGRDLAAYNIKFKDSEGILYNMWDLDIVKHLYLSLDTYNNNIKYMILINNTNLIPADLLEYAKINNLNAELLYAKLNRLNIAIIQESKCPLDELPDGSKVFPNEQKVKNYLMRELQNVLNVLGSKKISLIKVNKKLVTVDLNSIEVKPYELIMTKIYATLFGLKIGDNLQDIKQDKYFFLNRQLENWGAKTTSENYDIELKVLNGNHVYLKNSECGTIPDNLKKINKKYRKYKDGIYQIDERNNKIRLLYSELDEIYTDGNTEIIVTSNPAFYIDNINYSELNISTSVTESNYLLNKFIDNLNTANKNIKILEILLKGDIKQNIINNLLDLENQLEGLKGDLSMGLTLNLLTKYPRLRQLIINSQNIHTSFIKSLNVLAARIPSQCHQSFMAMQVVGFDDSGVNTAYVNKMQIYLQGSDY